MILDIANYSFHIKNMNGASVHSVNPFITDHAQSPHTKQVWQIRYAILKCLQLYPLYRYRLQIWQPYTRPLPA